MKPINILLIDDHPLFRSGLHTALLSGISNVQIFEADSLDEATLHTDIVPDVLLLDVQLEGINGLTGISLINRIWPRVQIIVLSADTSPELVQLAMQRGAIAYLSKTETSDTIIKVIEQALAQQPMAQPASGPRRRNDAPQLQLTARQCEVLNLLCQGLSNKIISQRLELSEHTIRGHVQALFILFQVSSRTEAVYKARQMGLIN